MLGALSGILSLFVAAIRYARYHHLLQKVFTAYTYIPKAFLLIFLQQVRRVLLGLWGFIWKVMGFSAALGGVRKEWSDEGFGFSSEVLRFEVCKMAEEWIYWR
jgi:hypothetical protein